MFFWIKEEGVNCLNYTTCENASRYNFIILINFERNNEELSFSEN